MKKRTEQYLADFFRNHPDCEFLRESFIRVTDIAVKCATSGHTLYTCGNGGSAADSQHMAGELLKSFCLKRKLGKEDRKKLQSVSPEDGDKIADNLQRGIKCIPLCSFDAYETAFLNDCDAEYVFAQLMFTLGDKGDCLFAFSTSGNSKNIVRACQAARAKGVTVIALTGQGGGKLKNLCDVLLNAPNTETFRIQEYHLPFYHLLCLCLESEMFDE